MLLLLLLLLLLLGMSYHAAICIDAHTPYAVNADAALPWLQFILLMLIGSVASCTIGQSQPLHGHQDQIRAAS